MKPDRSWSALVNPGAATNYFLTEKPLQPFVVMPEYNVNNALILSELARLVYSDDEEVRRESLRRANLTLLRFYEKGGTQAMLAIDTDNRYAALAFRGSSEPLDWYKTNFRAWPKKWSMGGSVHGGFADGLLRVWPKLERHLEQITVPLFVCGHSMGASLALLAASLRQPHAAYTFGSPRTGNTAFIQSLGTVPIQRIVHRFDPVQYVPLTLRHAGMLRWIGRENRAKAPAAWFAPNVKAYSLEVPPPKFLSDHAPIQYSSAIESLI